MNKSSCFFGGEFIMENGEEYLEEAIESILKQTFSHFEYIIVNDGSNHKTKEILDNITDS
jgi:glycosyltransferase involved in cell wall biosynthesis